MFTFRNGLQQLVWALQEALVARENVDIKVETPVQSFKPLRAYASAGTPWRCLPAHPDHGRSLPCLLAAPHSCC